MDAIFGIPPTVAIEQRTSRGGRKSTVATLDRDLSFPAPALRQARNPALPGLRYPIVPQIVDASPRASCGTTAAGASACSRRSSSSRKGYLQGSCELGGRPRLYSPACRWRVHPDRQMAAARPLPRTQRSSCRWPTCAYRRKRNGCARTSRCALDLGKGVVHVLDAIAGARTATAKASDPSFASMTADGIFGQARVSVVCPELSRAGSASVFVQLEARLVSGSAMAPGCRSTRCGGTTSAQRPARKTTSSIPGSNGSKSMRSVPRARAAAQSRSACGAIPRQIHRRATALSVEDVAGRSGDIDLAAAKPKSRATSWRNCVAPELSR